MVCNLARCGAIAKPVVAVARRWTCAGLAVSGRNHGFSLVELMIVLAILVTLAAIAVPNLQRSFQRNELREASRLLQETMGELRHEALESGRPIYLQLGWNSNSIRVLRDSNWLQAWSEATRPATGGESRDDRSRNVLTASEEIQLATDVRFQPSPIERNTGQKAGSSGGSGLPTRNEKPPMEPTGDSASQNGSFDQDSEMTAATTNRVVAWSKPLAILPDGSVDETQFWLELDGRWQCPVLFRGSTGHLEIGPVQTVRESTEPTDERELP
jgi:prepilin-type N-terminal cleavage/methylation domain-containing protein